MTVRLLTPIDRTMVLFLLLYISGLLLLPLLLDARELQQMFSEQGFFERASIAGWMFTAGIVLSRIRPLTKRSWAFILLYLLFAAREADWHKAFTADSLLKTNYYRHADAPLLEKMMAGMAVLLLLGLLVYVGIVMLRFLLREQGWRSRAGAWLLLGMVLIVLGKLLDRAPALLMEDYGVMLTPMQGRYASALEEGLEAVHPLILAWSAWISQAEKSYLS